jgi:hypothetical protein
MGMSAWRGVSISTWEIQRTTDLWDACVDPPTEHDLRSGKPSVR